MVTDVSNSAVANRIVWVANFGEVRAPFHEPTLLMRAALRKVPVAISTPYLSPVMFFSLEPDFQAHSVLIKQIPLVESLLASLSLMKTYGLLLCHGASYEDIFSESTMETANAVLEQFLEAAAVLFKSAPLRYRFDSNIVGEKIPNARKVELYSRFIDELPAIQSMQCDMENYNVRFVLINDSLGLHSRKEQANVLPGTSCQGARRVLLTVSTTLYLADMMRYHLKVYRLPERNYLGPTSMDHELAFIMCEVAGVKPGDVVCDPFAGTCSILVSASYYGCITIGSDLNLRVIRGKSDAEHFSSNFKQYGFQQPTISHQDVNQMGYQRLCFDAILCDPPYSIRAGSRKGRGSQPAETEITNESCANTGITEDDSSARKWSFAKFNIDSKHQDTADIFLSVLKFAVHSLKLNGRLVFWMPYLVHEFTKDDLPVHSDFECLHSLPQQITMLYGRRMCVYVRRDTLALDKDPYYKRVPSHSNFSEKIGFHKSECKL